MHKLVYYPTNNEGIFGCVGCGRCAVSCADGGHQAITMGEDRHPILNGKSCVGCHLCRLICPTGAIGAAKRIPKPKSR